MVVVFRVIGGSILIIVLALALPAGASQPNAVDWTEIVASGEGVRVAARRSGERLTSLAVTTKWGVETLSRNELQKLMNPDLGSLRAIYLPVDIDGSPEEYLVHLEFRAADFDDRWRICDAQKKWLDVDSAWIKIRRKQGVTIEVTKSVACTMKQ
jgi:hypothetical protein